MPKKVTYSDPTEPLEGDVEDFAFTRPAHQDIVQQVHTAIIGGEFTGNDRGGHAFDIQWARTDVAHVASGSQAIALGIDNEASGDDSIALGAQNTASGNGALTLGRQNSATAANAMAIGASASATGARSVAVGNTAQANAADAFAFGRDAQANGINSMALGYSAIANIDDTTNLVGPICIASGASSGGPSEWFRRICGAEVILTTPVVSLKEAGIYTIDLPLGCKFWLDSLGVICTAWNAILTQPEIRFGITGSLEKHLAPTVTTKLTAAGKRQTFTPLVPEDGETTLTASVTVNGGIGAIMEGRFYWKGLLIEDEA